MQELTLVLFLLCLGMFLARYLIKKTGVDYFTVLISASSLCVTLRDPEIASGDLPFVLLPSIFVLMVTLCFLAFDKKRV